MTTRRLGVAPVARRCGGEMWDPFGIGALSNKIDALSAKVDLVLQKETQAMAVLDDLQAADAAIQAAVQSAITLIQSLHTGTGSVSDADVEKVVADLNAAATALSGATPQP